MEAEAVPAMDRDTDQDMARAMGQGTDQDIRPQHQRQAEDLAGVPPLPRPYNMKDPVRSNPMPQASRHYHE